MKDRVLRLDFNHLGRVFENKVILFYKNIVDSNYDTIIQNSQTYKQNEFVILHNGIQRISYIAIWRLITIPK